MGDWTRLSMLLGPIDPEHCQRCGAECDLDRWQEHDGDDQPEPRVVVLCEPCGDGIVKKHPRLYRRLEDFEPWPGCMPLCIACEWRDGVTCTHSDLKANGGPGLKLTTSKGPPMFLCGHKSVAGIMENWGPTTACVGRSVKGTAGAPVIAFIGPVRPGEKDA